MLKHIQHTRWRRPYVRLNEGDILTPQVPYTSSDRTLLLCLATEWTDLVTGHEFSNRCPLWHLGRRKRMTWKWWTN